MPANIRVALIGDFHPDVVAHQAIPRALQDAARSLQTSVDGCWLATERITGAPDALLESFDAFWCVPASPYRDTDGALHAIRYARENDMPFLGTCGGFQHAVLEFARNVLMDTSAAHAELDADSPNAYIAPLACSLVEVTGSINIDKTSRLAVCYGVHRVDEGYHCSYGLNEAHRDALQNAGMRFTAFADDDSVRAFELDAHPFYVGTLFQPERAALRNKLSPPVVALLQAAQQQKKIPLGLA
jgi:CTP synthase (UTP-ammonia lyase)